MQTAYSTRLVLNPVLPVCYFPNRQNAVDFLLPTRALCSAKDSALFMKRLTAVALSNILKARGVFPDGSFITMENLDHDVHILDTTKVSGRKNVSQAAYYMRRMNGLFDAIDRKWVDKLHVRLMSQGTGKDDDGIEVFTFHFTYGAKPLIKLTYNGQPMCHAELATQTMVLMDSVNTLLESIEKMATTLPKLTQRSNPHLTIWMNKSSDAPAGYIAPGYPAGPLYGRIEYPPMKQVIYDGAVESNEVTSGWHTLSISHKFAEGNFGDSALFQRYYGDKKKGRRRVVELSGDESFDTQSGSESIESRSIKSDDRSDTDSYYRFRVNNKFDALSSREESESDEESVKEEDQRRRCDDDSDSDSD